MSLPVKIITQEGEELEEPYLLRIGGWTEERYFEEASETRIVEFEDGELIMHSPASIRHQQLVRFLTFLLGGYVSSQQMGEVVNGPAVVQLRPGLDYEPDIFFVATGQLKYLGEAYFSGAPTLIIEVLSPGSRNHDLRTKASHYGEYGVSEYWAVDPQRKTVYQHLLPTVSSTVYQVGKHTEGRLRSQAVAGFWIDVSWLWATPLSEELACLEYILGRR